MKDKVRVGVIGTSPYTDSMHLTNLASTPRAEVVAICGRRPEKTAALAAKYHIPQVYQNYNEMIKKAGLDAVIVSAPDDEHYVMAMAALDAGLHIICEKPLTSTAAQAKAMFEKAETAHLKHMTYFTYRWFPQYRFLIDLMSEQPLGKIHHLDLHYIDSYARSPKYSWRFDPAHGSGVLGDLGSHAIDLARQCLGDVVRVQATLTNMVKRYQLDGSPLADSNDLAVLKLEFVSGATANVTVCASAVLADRQTEQVFLFFGQEGTLESRYSWAGIHSDKPNRSPFTIQMAREGDEKFTELSVPESYIQACDPNNPYAVFTRQQVGNRLFIDAILDDLPIPQSFYDGWKAQEVIEAAARSAKSGSWETVETV
jgi:predicted dehydrogenase